MGNWHEQLDKLDNEFTTKLKQFKSRSRLVEVRGEDELGGQGMPRHPKNYTPNWKPLLPSNTSGR